MTANRLSPFLLVIGCIAVTGAAGPGRGFAQDAPPSGRTATVRVADATAADETFVIAMDACEGSIGTIACHKDYTVTFKRNGAGQWCSTSRGFQLSTSIDFTSADGCAPSRPTKSIVVFGAAFAVSPGKTEVYRDGTLVGHLQRPW